jgi:hypothetical protein
LHFPEFYVIYYEFVKFKRIPEYLTNNKNGIKRKSCSLGRYSTRGLTKPAQPAWQSMPQCVADVCCVVAAPRAGMVARPTVVEERRHDDKD